MFFVFLRPKKVSHNEVICPKIVSKQNEIREDQMAKCIKALHGRGFFGSRPGGGGKVTDGSPEKMGGKKRMEVLAS